MHIDKSVEPLGIQISCLESGGVFVSTVSEHSLASQVGLQVSGLQSEREETVTYPLTLYLNCYHK